MTSLANRQPVSADVVEEMAAAAGLVIVGAWDFEGLLYWEPTNVPATQEITPAPKLFPTARLRP